MDYININNLDKESNPKLIFEANLDISKGIANKSYLIKFPNNSNNNKHLDNLFSKYIGRKVSFPAQYTIEGVVLSGVLFITEISEYIASATFITGNGLVWNAMQQDSLKSVDLKHKNIVLNKENVIASESGYPFVVFDLTDRGAFKGGLNVIDITDRFPALNISQLLTEIFNFYGFNLNILDHTEYFNQLYLLFTGSEEVENDVEWLQDAAVEATGAFVTYSDSGTETSFSIDEKMLFSDNEKDPGNNYNSSRYSVPKDGTYQFKVTYNLRFQRQSLATVDNLTARIYLKKTGSEYYETSFLVDLSTVPYDEFSGVFDSRPIQLTTEDWVEIWINFEGDIDFSDTWNVTVSQGGTTKISIIPLRWYGYGSAVEISNILPNTTVSNFLKDVFSFLNINVFYDQNNNTVNLVVGQRQSNPIEQIEIWDYNEILKDKTNTVLQFNSDKARAKADKIIKIVDAQENIPNKFQFSRTLIAPCTRLFTSTNVTIPVLWQGGDPLNFSQASKPPKQNTLANLRILRKTIPVEGSYNLSYLGDTGLEIDTITSVLQFVEPDIRGLHLYDAALEKKVIQCYAKIDVNKLYTNTYFRNEVALINRDTKVPLLNGVIIKAEQEEGLIYKLTINPTAQEEIDSSIEDWFTPINAFNTNSVNDDFQSSDTSIYSTTAWGTIVGNLSDQTDLQEALDGKEPVISGGAANTFYAWDKTWKNPLSSIDLSNYVTLSGSQTITGGKIFTASSTTFRRAGVTGGGIILYPQINGNYDGYIVPTQNLSADRTWQFPNKSGNVVLDVDLANYVTLNTAQYITGLKTFITGSSGTIGLAIRRDEYTSWFTIGVSGVSSASYTGDLKFPNIHANRVWTLPDDTGTVALQGWTTNQLGNYVTITTAQTITGIKTIGNGAGQLNFKYNNQGANYRIVVSNNTASAYEGSLIFPIITATRSWSMPDKTGTFAMTSDIPAAITDYVTLTTAQSITGLKTFDNSKIAIKGSSTGKTTFTSLNSSATDYTISFKAATGTVAFTSDIVPTDLSNYVTLDGTQTITGLKNFNRVTFKAATDLSVKIVHEDGGQPLFITPPYNATPGSYVGRITMVALSASRTWTHPDKDGTYAMLSDIVTAEGVVPFTNTVNGLVNAPNRTWTIGTRFLADDNTWKEITTGGTTTSIELYGGTPRTGTIVLKSGSLITIVENPTSTFEFNHNTLTLSNINNSGVTYIQDLTFDGYGHVNGSTSATIPTFEGSTIGLVPAVITQANKYLKDDGTWDIPDGTSHDAVSLSGTPNYITLSGQDIIRALINLETHVTGSLPLTSIAGYPNTTGQYLSSLGWSNFPDFEPPISTGESTHYWAGNKTFKQIAYSEISGTPDVVDMSNYVTIGTTQTITGQKTFSDAIYILNGATIQLLPAGVSNTGLITNLNLSENRTWTLPNASGTIALTSDITDPNLSNYVTLDSSQTISGSKTFSNTSGIYIQNGSAILQILPSNSGSGYITNVALTDIRSWALPNKSGTFAMISDITSPDLSNYVTLNSSQTISGNKIFSSNAGVYFQNGATLQILPAGVSQSGQITNVSLTGSRVWTLPDKSGTFAMISDITTPDLSNYVTLNSTQSISGAKTFQQLANFPSIGLTYSSSYKSVIQSGTLSSNTLFQLPINNGSSGQVLTTNGNGITSWGDMSSSKWTDVSGVGISREGNVLIGTYSSQTLASGGKGLFVLGINESSAVRSLLFLSSNNRALMQMTNRGALSLYQGLYIGSPSETDTNFRPFIYMRSLYSDYSVKLQTVDSLASNYTLTLPATAGTNGYVLTTNGSGTLSWSPNGAGNYTVFTLNTNGLVPGPTVQNATTFLASDGNWYTVNAGITTSLKVSGGTPRVGDLTIVGTDGVTVANTSELVFTISHSDTSSVTDTSTSGYDVISGLTFDSKGHVQTVSTRSILPTTSTGLYLRDDGWFALPEGTEHDALTLDRGDRYITLTGQQLNVGLINVNWINATGRTDTNYLRGDGTWATPPTGSGTYNWYLEATGDLTSELIESGDIVTFTASGGTTVSRSNTTINIHSPIPTTTFLGLTDTPSTYVNNASKGVRVNSGGTALEFYTIEDGNLSNHSLTGSYHNDVSITNLQVGQILKWNGTYWTNSTDLVGTPGGGDGYIVSVLEAPGGLIFTGEGNAFSGTVALLELDPVFTAWETTSVGDNRYYGTDSSGVKGWYTSAHNHNGDYYTETEINQFFDGTTAILGYNKSNWDEAHGWGDHDGLYVTIGRTITINGTAYDLSADRSWSVGTVTGVGVGNGIVLGGTSAIPVLSIESVAGTANSVGTIVVSGNKIGVSLGTTNITAAAGNHTHDNLHSRSHSMAGRDDHSATAYRLFYSDKDGYVTELSFGTTDQILVSGGTAEAPLFKSLSQLSIFSETERGLVPAPGASEAATETRFLCADGSWSIPVGTGTAMPNPMTTTGDMIYRSSSQSATRLGIGTAGQVLKVKLVSGALVPAWEDGGVVNLSVTGDINISSAQNDALLQPVAITGKGVASTITDTNEFLISQSGLKRATASQIKAYINPMTTKGDLIVGGASGAISRLAATTTTGVRQVLTQLKGADTTTEWRNFDLPTLGTQYQLLRVNQAATALEYYTASALSAGNGLTGTAYNGQSAQTWSINFSVVAAANHTHTSFATLPSITAARILGRSSTAGTGSIQELTINTTAAESSMKFAGSVISAKLQNETAPVLGGNLNANSKNITNAGHIQSALVGSVPYYDLGTATNRWRAGYIDQLRTRQEIYLGGGESYYAGNASGDAKYRYVEATEIRSTMIKLGNNKFAIRYNGGGLEICFYNDMTSVYEIVSEIQSDGNMKFMN